MALDPLKSTTAATPVRPLNAAPTPAPTANAGPVMAPDQSTFTPDSANLVGLTEEEAKFVQEGSLPRNFAELRKVQKEQGKDAAIALFRQGKKGPFDKRYGDPDAMLSGARRFAKNPELGAMVKNIQPGDILVTTYNKTNDVIAVATKGPMVHALICVSKDPVPEFVEAIGMTGDVNDPNSNKVLHSMMGNTGYDDMSFRVMRPTAGLSPLEAEKAIKRAISYAENQLGKPYDFSFTDANGQGMNDAFYCSELAYKAYADKKGADLPIKLSKSSDRDEMLAAVADVLGGLKPDNKNQLNTDIVKLTAQKPLDEAKLVDFLVNQVAPGTEATRKIADTPERKAALKATLEKVIQGKAFNATTSAVANFSKQEAAGRYKGFTGFFRRVGDSVKIGWNGLKDARALTKGVGFWRSVGVLWTLGKTVIPHAEQVTGFLFGKDDPRTQSAKSTLDTLDGMARDVGHVPVIGGLLSRIWPLPSRARKEENRDFVSPTDLAWADTTHWDYNVKDSYPIDQEAFEKKWGK